MQRRFSNMPIYKRQFFILSMLIMLFLAIRLSMLFNSMNHIWCEEGCAGIMAKHLSEGNFTQTPFEYVQAYDFGMVVMSVLAVPFFWLFGISTVSLRLVPLSFNIGILILIYLLVAKISNRKTALLAGILYILAPPFYTRFSFYCVGKQHEVLFFELLAVYIFYRIFFSGVQDYTLSKTRYLFRLLGLVSGFAIFFCFSSLITLFSILLFWYIYDKRFFMKRQFLSFLGFFFIGLSPLIYYDLTRQINPLGFLLSYKGVNFLDFDFRYIIRMLKSVMNLVMNRLAEGFRFEAGMWFLSKEALNYLYYLIVIASFVSVFWWNRKSIYRLVTGLIPSERFNVNLAHISKEAFIITYPVMFFCFYCVATFFSKDVGWSLHYTTPLYPYYIILISLFLTKLYDYKIGAKGFYRLGCVGITVILVVVLLISNLKIIKKDDPWVGRMDKVISFLESKGIRYIYIGYSNQWPVAFESKESIIPSCEFISPEEFISGLQYRGYTEMVRSAAEYAVVLNRHDKYDRRDCKRMLEDYLNSHNIDYKKELADRSFVVYHSFSRDIRTKDLGFEISMRQ